MVVTSIIAIGHGQLWRVAAWDNVKVSSDVKASPTPTATSFAGDSADLSAVDDYYVGWAVEMTDGAYAGEIRAITSYAGSTRVLTFAALSGAPAPPDTFDILPKTDHDDWQRVLRLSGTGLGAQSRTRVGNTTAHIEEDTGLPAASAVVKNVWFHASLSYVLNSAGVFEPAGTALDAFNNLRWRLLKNGVAVPGYESLYPSSQLAVHAVTSPVWNNTYGAGNPVWPDNHAGAVIGSQYQHFSQPFSMTYARDMRISLPLANDEPALVTGDKLTVEAKMLDVVTWPDYAVEYDVFVLAEHTS